MNMDHVRYSKNIPWQLMNWIVQKCKPSLENVSVVIRLRWSNLAYCFEILLNFYCQSTPSPRFTSPKYNHIYCLNYAYRVWIAYL